MLIVVESGPLGRLCNPTSSEPAGDAHRWARHHLERGRRLVVPEISDYEVRRELVRAGLVEGARRLDELGAGLGFVPVTSAMWRRGDALDGDVLLAAQALELATEHDDDVRGGHQQQQASLPLVTAARWDRLR
jgi:hypothetical protein